MEFFASAVDTLGTIVTALGAVVGVWGVINLLEGYSNDNAQSKSAGLKMLIAGGGIALVGIGLVPQLATVFAISTPFSVIFRRITAAVSTVGSFFHGIVDVSVSIITFFR